MDKKIKQLIMLTLAGGLGYYFFIYLPEEERKEQEKQRLAYEEAQREAQQELNEVRKLAYQAKGIAERTKKGLDDWYSHSDNLKTGYDRNKFDSAISHLNIILNRLNGINYE